MLGTSAHVEWREDSEDRTAAFKSLKGSYGKDNELTLQRTELGRANSIYGKAL